MNNIYKCSDYIEDLNRVINADFLNFDVLKNKSILITGAGGLIGSFIVDVIMKLNNDMNINCNIYIVSRSYEKCKSRFGIYFGDRNFNYIINDINNKLDVNDVDTIDYVFHLASNAHPKAYATDPIGTITTNVIGTKNILDLSVEKNTKRFLFTSTCEIYGENKGDTEKFKENYLGYINCNMMRAGYPESKRCGEALCQAYISQTKLDIVIPRLSRTFGPTMIEDDSKALAQFIKKGINNENIVLKSEGNQFFSYTYVVDAVTGIFKVLFDGKCGEAYNISNEWCDIRLKDLAQIVADSVGTKVVFELPNEIECAGFSNTIKSRLDNSKLIDLGWKPFYNIKDAVEQTINILKKL